MPAGAASAITAWGGHVSLVEGGLLVAAYAGYAGVIWALEGKPRAIGETGELDEARHKASAATTRRRVGRDLVVIVAGIAMSVGATQLSRESATWLTPTHLKPVSV